MRNPALLTVIIEWVPRSDAADRWHRAYELLLRAGASRQSPPRLPGTDQKLDPTPVTNKTSPAAPAK